MSRSNRHGQLTLALVALSVFVFLVAVTWAVISEQYARIHQAYSTYQQTAAADRREATDEIARACEGMQSVAFADCIADRVESYYRDQATNEDLQAQQDMAFWAQWMFIATIFTVMLTAFGIWLVYMNLREARKVTSEAVRSADAAQDAVEVTTRTLDETRLIGRRQVRAYLSCEGGTFAVEKGYFSCRPLLKNHGQSPASKISIVAYAMWTTITKRADESVPNIINRRSKPIEVRCTSIAAQGQGHGLLLWTHIDMGEGYDALYKSAAGFTIACRLHWTDVFGDSQSIAFTLMGEGDPILLFDEPKDAKTGELNAYNQDPADQQRD